MYFCNMEIIANIEFSKIVNNLLKHPVSSSIKVSFLFAFVGMFIDALYYYNNNITVLLVLNIIALAIVFVSFMFFVLKKINYKLALAILVYLLVSNIVVSNIILQHQGVADWQFNILRDTFAIAIFVTLTGFALHSINFIIINIMYSVSIIYLYIVSFPSYVSENAIYLIIIMAGFSYGIYFFRTRFWKSINENRQYMQQVSEAKHELLQKEADLNREKSLRLQEQLNYKNKELISSALAIAQNAEVKNKLSDKLDSVKEKIDEQSIVEFNHLLSKISASQKSKHWNEFQKRFNDVHEDFYKNISNLYPSLSTGDKRLAAFIKLGMSSKEIALLTQITKESVDVGRSRLRKKMSIAKTDNLSVILSEI